MDKPQELNFSQEAYYQKSLEDLLALCALKDDVTTQHTKILCESYYWQKFGMPKGMLLRGIQLTKMTRLKSSCDGDEESPSFVPMQNEFLSASEKFVSSEVTRKRKVFLAFNDTLRDLSVAIDLELRLQNISTWFDDFETAATEQSDFIEAILNSETIVHLTNAIDEEEDLKLAFARSNDKRILHVTNSEEVFAKHQKSGDKSFYFWKEGTSLEELVTAIKGDAKYVSAHALLLEAAYNWEKSGKSENKLLHLKEAEAQKEWYQAAEAQKLEPKPNIKMIDFIERSIVHGAVLARRKKMALWTTIIGIVLLVIFGGGTWYFGERAKTANEELTQSQKEKVEAEQAKSAAMKAKEDAEKAALSANEMLSKAKKQQKALALKKQQLEVEIAEQHQNIKKAQNEVKAKETLIAEKERQMASMDTQIAQLQLDQDSLNLAIIDIEKQAERIRLRNLGNEEARQAYQNIRFGLRTAAQELADSAVVHLTKGEAPTQIQPLYDVYKELVPNAHPLSSINRENEADLNLVLLANNTKSSALNPAVNATDPTSIETAETLSGSKSHQYATHRTSDNSNFIAVGFKDGSVSIYNSKTNALVASFTNHSHRITSIAFSEDNTFMAVASVDNSFSIIPLNPNTYTRNNHLEIIEQENDTRIETIYFLNNHTVITQSVIGARAWGVNVAELIKIVSNEH